MPPGLSLVTITEVHVPQVHVPTIPTVPGTYGTYRRYLRYVDTVGTSLYCGIRSQRACVALNVLSEDTLEQASLSPE